MLDSTTGQATITEGDTDEVIIGEYDGTVLVAQGDELVARTSANGDEVWRLDTSKYDLKSAQLTPAAGVRPGPGLAFVQDRDGSGILLDLEDGAVIGSNLRDAATDASAGVHVLISDTEVYGQDGDGEVLWRHPASDQTTVTAIGHLLVYLQFGGTLRVHNVLTGDVALGYAPDQDGRIVVPTLINDNGAGVVLDESRYYVVTNPPE